MSVASKFREAEETVKISMTSSTTIIGYSASFEVCFWHSPEKAGGRQRGRERKDARWTSKDHPRGEQKRSEGGGHRNIVSEWSGVARTRRNGGGVGGWVDPLRRGGRKMSCPVVRERPPHVVPGGPRPVETAQRLKARGIILL